MQTLGWRPLQFSCEIWAHRWYWTASSVSHRILFASSEKWLPAGQLKLTIHGWRAQSIYPRGKDWRFYLWSFLLILRVCCSQLQPFRSCEECFTPRKTHAAVLRNICAVPRLMPGLLCFSPFVTCSPKSTRTHRLGETWTAFRGWKGLPQEHVRPHCLQSPFTTCHKIHANPSSWLSFPAWLNLSGAHTGEALAGATATRSTGFHVWAPLIWMAGRLHDRGSNKQISSCQPRPEWNFVGSGLCSWVERLLCRLGLSQISKALSPAL